MAEHAAIGHAHTAHIRPVDPGNVWALLNTVVRDSRREWTRLVSAEAGMPYSRVRALRALAEGDLPMGELARQVVVDSSAATGILNDLEARGLAERRSSPESRRVRIASITPAGRALVERVERIEIPRPAALEAMSEADLCALDRLLRPLLPQATAASHRHGESGPDADEWMR